MFKRLNFDYQKPKLSKSLKLKSIKIIQPNAQKYKDLQTKRLKSLKIVKLNTIRKFKDQKA